MRIIDTAARAAFDAAHPQWTSEARDHHWVFKPTRDKWITATRAAFASAMTPSRFVLQRVHDGPLMADDHHMDAKTTAWLIEMHQATFQAILDERE